MAKDGGPAFPRPAVLMPNGHPWDDAEEGMSVRDWFAGMAAQGFIAGLRGEVLVEMSPDDAKALLAAEAYGVADALLAAREED